MHKQLVTQIKGIATPQEKVAALRSQLRDLDVRIAPAHADSFNKNMAQVGWAKYEDQMNLYDCIARSSFHMVLNEGVLDRETTLEILYAMTKDKAVVLSQPPKFSSNVSPFMREVLSSRMNKIKVGDLADLELAELSYLINGLPGDVDYRLTDHESALIRSQVKAHFRELLEEAKKQFNAAQV